LRHDLDGQPGTLRETEFTDMADQVAYSRLYMAGHYRSDLTSGAYLGYLIGDYETATKP
jgi:hypothetical protein